MPHTFDTWVQTISFVSGRRARRNASTVASLSPGYTRAWVKETSCSASFRSGRITALCSRHDTTAWLPGVSVPLITALRAWVQFMVKTTQDESGA